MTKLSEYQIDAIQELINLGVGRAASLLNNILNRHVILTVPSIKMISVYSLVDEFNNDSIGKVSCVDLKFRGSIKGSSKLFFPSESVAQFVSIFAPDEDPNDFVDELRMGTLVEIGNIVLNSLIGSLSNQLKIDLIYSIPQYIEFNGNVNDFKIEDPENSSFIHAKTQFKINDMNIDGSFVLSLEIGSFNQFITLVDKMIESY
jgi:chemotaxis protein CheC